MTINLKCTFHVSLQAYQVLHFQDNSCSYTLGDLLSSCPASNLQQTHSIFLFLFPTYQKSLKSQKSLSTDFHIHLPTISICQNVLCSLACNQAYILVILSKAYFFFSLFVHRIPFFIYLSTLVIPYHKTNSLIL